MEANFIHIESHIPWNYSQKFDIFDIKNPLLLILPLGLVGFGKLVHHQVALLFRSILFLVFVLPRRHSIKILPKRQNFKREKILKTKWSDNIEK